MQDTGWNGAPSLSCILHHASCIFLYSKKCSGTAETRGSARVPHPRPMRTGLAPHPRFGPTSIFLNSRRGIQKIERLGARSSVLGVGPAPVPGPRFRVPVAKIRTLPILHHASCILHLYLTKQYGNDSDLWTFVLKKFWGLSMESGSYLAPCTQRGNTAVRQYGHMAISYYPSFVTRHSSLHHFVTPSLLYPFAEAVGRACRISTTVV
jgi:hypothetical protein